MTITRLAILISIPCVWLASASGWAARGSVPLPRPAPESIKPAPAEPAPPAPAVVGTPMASPVIGARKADFQQVQNWTVKCIGAAAAPDRQCILYQTILFGDENPSLVVARAGYVAGESDPVLEVRVPMGVRLATGLTLMVDGKAERTLPFERCGHDGCLVRTGLGADLLARLTSGQTLDLQVEDQGHNAVRVRMSLVGFTTALGMAKP